MKGDAMNPDPVYQKWQEISWRRPLTGAEQADLRAWLIAHPEAPADVEADAVLSAALKKLPDAPLPSNFTARVLQAVEREAVGEKTPAPRGGSWWRRLLPRLALASLVLVSGGLFYRHNQDSQREQMTQAARQVATAPSLSDPAMLQDYEVIASLTPAMAVADENLLALSDDLMALGK